MTLTEGQKKANAKYREKSIKRIPLDVQKEEYEEIKAAADAAGEKVNEYIKKAIRQRMEQKTNSSPTAAALLSDQRPEASPEKPAAVPEVREPEKGERKTVLQLTSENIATVDLDRLVDDFRYQMDISAAFGMDGLARLLKQAREDRFRIRKHETGVGSPAREFQNHPEASQEKPDASADNFARSLVDIAKRNGSFKV